MKKTILAILLASAFATPAIFAQGPGNPPDPTKFVARRVQHLTTLLDLTPGQVSTATAAFTTAATANAALEPQLRAAHQALRSDIQGTGDITADATAVANLEAKVLINDATAEKALWGSLTSIQQEKLKALGPGGFGGHGPHGPGGFGPGR